MGLISAQSLATNSEYMENKLKLKVMHFCPIDGLESDPQCKRIVVCSDLSAQAQPQQPIERYLVVIFYGSYAKTPFKKSGLKSGQLFTLHRFRTGIMPKNKVFKCNGILLKDFYDPVVIVRPEMEPTIKMLVSLREESNLTEEIQNNDSIEDNHPIEATNDSPIEDIRTERLAHKKSNEPKECQRVKSPAKKRLKFGSSEDDLSDIDLCSDEEFDTSSRRALMSSTINEKNSRDNRKRDPNIRKSTPNATNVSNKSHNKSDSDRNHLNSNETNSVVKRRHEYKTLIEVHNLMPVSGRTYVHIYGILRYRDFRQNTIHLRDEKAYTFTVQLRPGNSTFRHYPAFRPGDLLRIHRLLVAPNSMDVICTDPKDVVVFEAFQDSDSFSPINTSLKPTFEQFDRDRKQEMDEWFADELLSDSLSEKKASSYSAYTDLAVQVIRVTTQRERSFLEVWDTTKPALRTTKSQVSTDGMNLDRSEEELVRIVNENEMSIVVTAYEQHSNDAQRLKPFDFIVIFNVNIRTDRFNPNRFTFTLNSSYNYGKCIRFVRPNSCLGKKLFARIEDYKVMSAVNVVNTSDEFPQESQPIDIENETETGGHEESTQLSQLSDDFDINLNEVVDVLDRNESYLPAVPFVDIPETSLLIEELITKGVDKHLYKLKARVIAYLPTTYERRDVISVLCTNQECHRMITLRQAISDDPLIEPIIESSKDQKLILNCLQCKQSSSVLMFKLSLILEDSKHNKVLAQLFGHNAELFLKATPEEVLQIETKWAYVERVLNYICPKIASIDAKTCNNVLIFWVIQPSRVVNDRDVFCYQIRTAVAVETADKCIGVCIT